MATALKPQTGLASLGQIVMTAGIRDFVDTGVLPYQTEPQEAHLGVDYRRLWLTTILVCHSRGDWGDCPAEDAELNDEVRNNPGQGGRLMSVWDREDYPKTWIITDGYGTDYCVTTVLFSSEY